MAKKVATLVLLLPILLLLFNGCLCHFRVTDVTDVAIFGKVAKKVATVFFGHPDFSLELQRKVASGHFL